MHFSFDIQRVVLIRHYLLKRGPGQRVCCNSLQNFYESLNKIYDTKSNVATWKDVKINNEQKSKKTFAVQYHGMVADICQFFCYYPHFVLKQYLKKSKCIADSARRIC